MKADTILLAHGSGGRLSAELIRSVFVPAFGNPALNRMDDAAVINLAISYLLPANERASKQASERRGARGEYSALPVPLGEPQNLPLPEGEPPNPPLPLGEGRGEGRPRREHRAAGDEPPPYGVAVREDAPQSSVLSPQSFPPGRLAVTTDSHVVKPLFFEGGDIGRLAVCGTVNDLAMVGARPLYLTAAFVLEEGMPVATLERVVSSMRSAAEEAGVAIVAGDTKVVERGSADEMFITTTGVGVVPEGVSISGSNARPGDIVVLSGPIGDHGLAVLSKREGLEFGSSIASDVAPLNHLTSAMLEAAPHIHCLRDPTRGGLATTLDELAAQSSVAIQIEEDLIPIRPAVRAACEMLGYDPFYVANEGKLVAIIPPEEAEAALKALRRTRYGEEGGVIGRVLPEPVGRVLMKTRIGGTRIVQVLTGELLPRIC